MTQSQVTLFSKPNCQYCDLAPRASEADRAKAVLKRANVNYQEYDVTSNGKSKCDRLWTRLP